ncbi:MAG TPA: PD-(D/E)XK nuclease family protein [Phycisphaerales bacterium]|nr:PD-(D/E)XK nuclease family protein [Phycisphaerales bacterium]HMP38632.1 PD-(D/E)XK nuclease family protein [Phycisphaerales bacterium]
MPNLELPEIRATSPTLAETMRACLLRAALSKASGSSSFVLGSPKAWLGTAYHEVLEKIVEIDLSQESLDGAVERLWDLAIAAQQQRADAHVLDRRFGSPTTWPAYHVARASVLLRAGELSAAPASAVAPATEEPRTGLAPTIREQEFTAFGGRLLGRPDVIRASEVVDYKSGAIVEHDAATLTNVVKAAYVRQLRIYGYLVKQKLGWWPKRGVLLPLGGAGVEVELEPSECEREASDAVALLDVYNGKVRSGAAPQEFASPSPESCRWCAYKLVCPAFWQAASPDWSGQLDGAAVEGPLVGAPAVIHAGAARAIAVDVEAGTEARRQAQIAPLNPSAHPVVASLAQADRVRLVGVRVRSDGALGPAQRTVLARVADLPVITLARSAKGVGQAGMRQEPRP